MFFRKMIIPETEGVLVSELNLRMTRAPKETNAPDQGYPMVGNLEVISID